MTTDFSEIPVIDFGRFHNGNKEEKAEIANQIGEACRKVGFFYLKNHGVTAKLTEDVMTVAKQYFALPLDVKMRHAVGDMSKGQVRGFLTYRSGDCPDIGDQKEAFNLGLELSEDDPEVKRGATLQGPNTWPDLPGFRETIYDGYYLAIKELAQQVAGAFALALKLPEDYFVPLTDKPVANMSVIYYPPQSLDKPLDKNRIGALQHTDFGAFTLLQQSNDVTALQVQNIKKEWIDAKPIEGALVVNIGDTMQRWTNDQFVSTLHRVINVSDKERYSIAFFFGPNYFTNVDCIPTCYDDKENPKKYKPILSGEFVHHRLETCHLTDNDERDIGRLPGAEQNKPIDHEHTS
ncbi:hypothetical protein I4U23_000049 [Adineta vaga]|nr:hypothetical protein I4U23_000049 [Adineta vaga]